MQSVSSLVQKPKGLFIKTFGCQMNERDSEIMIQLMVPEGYLFTDSMERADIILLNTCSIRAKAEQKVFSLLGQLKPLKQARPELLIGVTGCVAQQEGERIFQRMPHVDLVVGTQQLDQLPVLVRQAHQHPGRHQLAIDQSNTAALPSFSDTARPEPQYLPGPAYKKFVTIMQGCNNFCSYCVVPFTRGRETSRARADILAEVEGLVRRGVREVTLLGQNVNSYGKTNSVGPSGYTFADLLADVGAIQGLKRLRFTTSNPKDLSRELIRCFQEIATLCPHLHLPVQSGSDRILKLMNRKYNRKHYLALVEALRAVRPDIALTTDIIVGFPGETDQDFRQTLDLLARVRFNGSFSFCYSDRPHTRSTSFQGKVGEKEKRVRLHELQQLQDAITLELNQQLLGSSLEIMVEKIAPNGGIQGRTRYNHVVHCPSSPSQEQGETVRPLPGALFEVKITGCGKHSLRGCPLD